MPQEVFDLLKAECQRGAKKDNYGIPSLEFELLKASVDTAHVMADDFDQWNALHSIVEVNWTGKGQLDYRDHLPEKKAIRVTPFIPGTRKEISGFPARS
jgi:hypothetical protein